MLYMDREQNGPIIPRENTRAALAVAAGLLAMGALVVLMSLPISLVVGGPLYGVLLVGAALLLFGFGSVAIGKIREHNAH